ncbi:M23 family metallopeptidase [Gottfriedia acidiceleris]|uniref:M23 family metallopeptidase n=1 Tax=Gottfriedia acidiceleris TaxID=371036 RepID=A0ABY4JSG5_9BACI|nr:M23 family metallopeptidase [Gottfriedia acidiceleris]UPM55265.1 M23 family metallopeptidase [Gottfriedia acidiceleris]
MSKRVDDIRKRIAKRREQEEKWGNPNQLMSKFPVKEVQNTEGGYTYTYDDLVEEQGKKIMNNSNFMFRSLLCAIIVLALAIILKSNSPMASQVRHGLSQVYESEFQFASLQKWYEDRFGSPIAFLPQLNDQKQNVGNDNYAVPASGKVLQSFKTDGQGILIQTEANQKVESIKKGRVLFVGKKDNLGNTVIIQHADGSESWYGKLGTTNVKIYDEVDSKKVIGTVSSNDEGNLGTYYFAIKMGEKFIDPKQVISFE